MSTTSILLVDRTIIMPTLREKFFESKQVKKDHVSESDLRDLLICVNRLKSYTDLTLHFDDEILDEEKWNKILSDCTCSANYCSRNCFRI